MPYEIVKNDIDNRANRPYEKFTPIGWAVHSTSDQGATDENERQYFETHNVSASANYVADWDSITEMIPPDERSYHAGSTANHKYISVEMCEPRDDDPDRVNKFNEVWKRTVWLIAQDSIGRGWTSEEDWSHKGISQLYHETDHIDPYPYFAKYGKTWQNFLDAVDAEIKNIKEGATVAEVTEPVTNQDPDVNLMVWVRSSKAADLIKQIQALGFACEQLPIPLTRITKQ